MGQDTATPNRSAPGGKPVGGCEQRLTNIGSRLAKCGKPAHGIHEGKYLCETHLRVTLKRERDRRQFEAERALTNSVEDTWTGQAPSQAEELEDCREGFETMSQRLREEIDVNLEATLHTARRLDALEIALRKCVQALAAAVPALFQDNSEASRCIHEALALGTKTLEEK